MKVAIVSGASSGMGRDFAKILASNQEVDEIWLIARRKDALEQLADRLDVPCRVISLDLQQPNTYQRIEQMVKESKVEISWLVYAAGVGLIGSVEEISEKDTMGMIELNVIAVTMLTKALLPYITSHGTLVFFASSASFLPQPFFAVYAATKSYVLSFCRALSIELKGRSIHVCAVCPGPVNTEFFLTAEKIHKTSRYKMMFMSKSEDVVRLAYRDIKRKKSISIYGLSMKCVHVLSKVLPTNWILKFYC